jgi:hypothetical protein
MTAAAMTTPGMDWLGRAFLVIANTVAPTALAEYEAWHSIEHVPERLTMPGFLGGRRFVRGRGARSHFLTLYDIEAPGALDTPEYRHLLDNPTMASRNMRPLMGDFRRFVYRETDRYGDCRGSYLGFLRWRSHDGQEDRDIACLAGVVGHNGIVGLRVGASHAAKAHPAFATEPALSIPHHAALVSGKSEAELRAALGRADQFGGFVLEHDVYRLIFAD